MFSMACSEISGRQPAVGTTAADLAASPEEQPKERACLTGKNLGEESMFSMVCCRFPERL
jgi:hypothetical protein